jgi:HK97 family phage major capsid protein
MTARRSKGDGTGGAGDGVQAKTLGEHFVKSIGDSVGVLGNRGGKLAAPEFEAKAPATQTTNWPAGVPILTDYDRTIVQARRERPTIADLCGSGTISGNAISYFVEAAMQGGFATVAEGGAKPQISFDNPTAVVDALKKIAGWIDLTDEFIEDLGFLKSEIDTRLLYQLTMFEEAQLLSGNGTGQNLLGIRNRSGVQVQAAPADAADNAKKYAAAARAAIARRERARAARRATECLDPDVSPELFFPSESATTALQIEQAKAACALCPVIEVCRRNALEGGTETDYGVFGGLTRNERRALKRQMRGAA